MPEGFSTTVSSGTAFISLALDLSADSSLSSSILMPANEVVLFIYKALTKVFLPLLKEESFGLVSTGVVILTGNFLLILPFKLLIAEAKFEL